MTNQEAFDEVCLHLAQQKRRCTVEGTLCKYRHRGMKCAVGALIPDDEYRAEFDNETFGMEVLKEQIPSLRGISTSLLVKLQLAHDGSYSLQQLHRRLIEIAANYDLDANSVTKITEWEGATT